MIRCIAIDDEKLALDLIEDNIRQIPFLELVKRCKNAMEAIDGLRAGDIDLIFLDIELPGLSGLQFLKSLPIKPMVILITAYDNYALEGFNLDAIDYLVKPVSFERFLRSCNKAYDYFLPRKKLQDIPERDYMFVHVEYNQVKLNFADIRYIEAMKDYIRIHLMNEKPVVTRQSMKSMEEKLPPKDFVRVHKSYIVAVSKIQAIKRGLLVSGNHEIPMSDSYKPNLDVQLGLQPE